METGFFMFGPFNLAHITDHPYLFPLVDRFRPATVVATINWGW